jgi:hypothetical protein
MIEIWYTLQSQLGEGANSMAVMSIKSGRSIEDWDRTFNRWAQGPSETEQEKCDNAVRMVNDAIRAHDGLRSRDIKVFAQGSYRNRTNVRMDSDVDVCVLCMDTFFADYDFVPGVNSSTLGFSDASYSFDELKRDVEAALVAKFGRRAVTRGDKAFDIKENTYRVSADVVPTFEGRLRNSLGTLAYHSGTVLECTSNRRRINNWPEQHYANGVQKHGRTDKQFKKKVRCLKNLCNTMVAAKIASAEKMASFLLESLVYNCPDKVFTQATHYEDVKAVIAYLWGKTQDDTEAKDMLEVNDIKYLFHVTQAWERTDVHQFLFDAWVYVGFEN